MTTPKLVFLLSIITFNLDYFIFTPPEKKIQICLFWIAIGVFNIWYAVTHKDNEKIEEKEKDNE